jgi:AcrR family transcriptional regulator
MEVVTVRYRMDMPRRKTGSLTADDWTQTALDALARGGLAAVSVEPLAKELGATKGSFYWHFADRNALITAALDRWETHSTELVIATVERTGDVVTRLRDLLRYAFSATVGDRGATTGAVELALQANADHALVSATLARVTERRLAYLTALFIELGMSPARARDRGILAYTAYLGHLQLAHATPDLLPQGRAFASHVSRVVDSLVRIDD